MEVEYLEDRCAFPKRTLGILSRDHQRGRVNVQLCTAVWPKTKTPVSLLRLSSCSSFTPYTLESGHLGYWTFLSFPSPPWDKSALSICSPAASSAQAASFSQTQGGGGVSSHRYSFLTSILPSSFFLLLSLFQLCHPLLHIFAVIHRSQSHSLYWFSFKSTLESAGKRKFNWRIAIVRVIRGDVCINVLIDRGGPIPLRAVLRGRRSWVI